MAKPRRKVKVVLELEICRDWNADDVFEQMREMLPGTGPLGTWGVVRMYRMQRASLLEEAGRLLKLIGGDEAKDLASRIAESLKR